MLRNRKFQAFVINRFATFKSIFDEAGMYCPQEYISIYCPFHPNFDTKAAKLYKNESGEAIWCFAEQKTYKPVHAIEKFLGSNIARFFDKLWVSLDELERAGVQRDFKEVAGVSSTETEEAIPLEYRLRLEAFKRRQITYTEYVLELEKYLKGEKIEHE